MVWSCLAGELGDHVVDLGAAWEEFFGVFFDELALQGAVGDLACGVAAEEGEHDVVARGFFGEAGDVFD